MNPPFIITGRKVLVWMVLFFATIFAVNGTFFYLAMDSWPGLVTENPYESGLEYNQVLDSAERQSQLGWQSTLDVTELDNAHHIAVTVRDDTDNPIAGLQIQVVFRRPVNDVENLSIILSEKADGKYSSGVSLPSLGRWYVDLTAVQAPATTYRYEYEIMVRP